MKERIHNNDNAELSFITLKAATLNVVRYLEGTEKQHEESGRNTDRHRAQEQNSEDHRRAVEQRLRDLAAFERRAAGRKDSC